jgi:cutinase
MSGFFFARKKINMIRKILAALAVLAAAVITPVAMSAPAAAAPPCVGVWTVGVGGFVLGPQDSRFFNVHQPVGYAGWDAQAGLNELHRLVYDHRRMCPGDQIKIIGHSQGAGIIHTFAQRNPWLAPAASAILLGDPKRMGPPEGHGMAHDVIPNWHVLHGVDNNFGGWPTVTVCRRADGVCNRPGGSFVGNPAHSAYEFNVHWYPNRANGHWFWP